MGGSRATAWRGPAAPLCTIQVRSLALRRSWRGLACASSPRRACWRGSAAATRTAARVGLYPIVRRITAQPLYTRFPIIFSRCFSKLTIGYNPRRGRARRRPRAGPAGGRVAAGLAAVSRCRERPARAAGHRPPARGLGPARGPGAPDRTSPNVMGRASLGREIGIFCESRYGVLLLHDILGLYFSGLALCRPQARARVPRLAERDGELFRVRRGQCVPRRPLCPSLTVAVRAGARDHYPEQLWDAAVCCFTIRVQCITFNTSKRRCAHTSIV
jgi:hypothetical protein